MVGDELFDDLPEVSPEGKSIPAGAPRLRVPVRDQIELRAVDLESLIGGDHPVRVIWGYVEGLDLSVLEAGIRAREGVAGHPPISPRLMLALWLYGTSDGVGSARALARLCESHDAYRWLCGGVSVNYHTLSDFRLSCPALLDDLLTRNVAALSAAGVIDLDEVVQDGVRVRAAAGSGSYRRKKSLGKELAKARRLVARLKREGDEDHGASNRRIAAARQRAARERVARIEAALGKVAEIEAEQERRAEASKARGGKARGGKAKADKPREPRASTTDSQARVMKMADGGFRPAYNGQLETVAQGQIVVGIGIDMTGSDRGLLREAASRFEARYERWPRRWVVDGGFNKNDDTQWAAERGVKVYGPPTRNKHGTDPYAPRPGDKPGVAAWRRRMGSPHGKSVYRRRAPGECINARLRQWGLHRFTVRGCNKVTTVLHWFALANNILQTHRLTSPAPA